MSKAPTAESYKPFSIRRSKRLQPLRRGLELALVRAGLAAAERLPLPALQRLGAALGALSYYLAAKKRGVCLYQLGMALPGLDRAARRRLARRVFRHAGTTVCEALALPRIRREGERWVALENEQALRDAHARGRGVMLVTAHAGNWELLPVALARLDIKAVAVARSLPNPRVNALVLGLRRTPHLEIAERGSEASPRRLLNCLRRGEALVMVNDQDINAQGVFVDFFGIPAHTPRAPASLALKRDAPVVTYFDVRRPDGTHVLRFDEIPVTDAIRGAPDPVQALTQAISTATEAHIRAHPEQWAWSHRRWKRRPPGESSPS